MNEIEFLQEKRDKIWCIDMAHQIRDDKQLWENIIKRQNLFEEFGSGIIGKVINTEKNKYPCKSMEGHWIWESPLNESSLSRIMQLQAVGFFSINGYRFEDEYGDIVLQETNIKKDEELKTEIRSKNLGYIELHGWSQEKHLNKDTQEIELKDIEEKSILVPYTEKCGMNKKDFKKYALQLAKDYKQYTILYYNPQEEIGQMYLLYSNGNVFSSLVPEFNVTKIAKIYSTHLAKGSHGYKAAKKRKQME